MTAIPDLDLTVRLGALDAGTVESLHRFAVGAARWRGLAHGDVMDVVRGLHWLALGYSEHTRSADMIGVLLLTPRSAVTCAGLGAAVDHMYAATVARRHAAVPPDPLGLTDRHLLGWRLTIALELVRDVERRSAASPTRSAR